MTDRTKLKQRYLRAKKAILVRWGMTPRKAEFYAKRAWARTVKETRG